MGDTVDLRELNWVGNKYSLNTAGMFLKSRVVYNGKEYYLKMSNYDSYRGTFGHEAVNEVIASRLGKKLKIDVPKYKLVKALIRVDGKEIISNISMSESYKNSDEYRETLEYNYEFNRISVDESPLEYLKRIGYTDYVNKMFIFDFIIINRDRHGANIEMLTDKRTSHTRISPLFDNGISFVFSTYGNIEAIKNFDIHKDYVVNNFVGSRSLNYNLGLIDRPVNLGILTENDKSSLFYGLGDAITKEQRNKIWDIIWGRYNYVKKVCTIRE